MELRPSLFNIHPWTQPFIWGHSNCTPSRYSAAYFSENGWMMEISHQLKKKYYVWKILEHKCQLYLTSTKGLTQMQMQMQMGFSWKSAKPVQPDFGGCGLPKIYKATVFPWLMSSLEYYPSFSQNIVIIST